MTAHEIKLENHPNFQMSADYNKSKRLAIKKYYDLKRKIAEIDKLSNVEIKEEQAEINKKAQRTVES